MRSPAAHMRERQGRSTLLLRRARGCGAALGGGIRRPALAPARACSAAAPKKRLPSAAAGHPAATACSERADRGRPDHLRASLVPTVAWCTLLAAATHHDSPRINGHSPCSLPSPSPQAVVVPTFKLVLVGDGGVGKTTFVKCVAPGRRDNRRVAGRRRGAQHRLAEGPASRRFDVKVDPPSAPLPSMRPSHHAPLPRAQAPLDGRV
jgi:hypothetical protein